MITSRVGTRKLFEILHFFVICDLLFTHNINEYDCISNTFFFTKMKDLDNSKLLLPPANLRRLCFHRCLSVHGGVPASLHAGIHTPPWADTPLPSACWDTPPPPCAVHAGIRATGGRYASHWNAFLFTKVSMYHLTKRLGKVTIVSKVRVHVSVAAYITSHCIGLGLC